MTPDRHVSIPAYVEARDVGSDFVLVNLATGSYFGLNPVGARMWALLAAGLGTGEVVAAVSAEYGVPGERAAADLKRLLAALAEQGLVED